MPFSFHFQQQIRSCWYFIVKTLFYTWLPRMGWLHLFWLDEGAVALYFTGKWRLGVGQRLRSKAGKMQASIFLFAVMFVCQLVF